jgi:hypothetical protein
VQKAELMSIILFTLLNLSNYMDLVDLLFKVGEMSQRQAQIDRQEEALRQSQGMEHTLLEAQVSNSKHNLEMAKLGRFTVWLTILIIVLMLIQLLR